MESKQLSASLYRMLKRRIARSGSKYKVAVTIFRNGKFCLLLAIEFVYFEWYRYASLSDGVTF